MPGQANGQGLRRLLGVEWTGEFAHPTLVMGIVNITPDSFQQVGRFTDMASAVGHGMFLADEGADILDVGGESTRPGAAPVSTDEEAARVVPVVRALASACTIPISVDTRNSEVAAAALDAGARIINDVSAGRHDPRMFATAAGRDAFLCLMHGPLDPARMKWSTATEDSGETLISGINCFLRERVSAALDQGVAEKRIWVDPGFGFGKSVNGNLRILRDLKTITDLPWPVLLGVSRKSTLGAVLDSAPPEERLEATLAALALAAGSAVSILRVHDVRAAVRAVRLADAVAYAPAADQGAGA